ncbi:hypothetical protein [Nostoc sp. GT001]|uniref:hypothetical protein n=1 Tax=Nostoc sp. GT001 TaxID=3056647 RepID=UPI0025AAA064|nr:hypothetical protein [Nostoc sp. GT001]MDM9586176.1 hypothetical protein [Nostoc sp. GT001]
MSEIPLCSIVISSQLPSNEIESLETLLGMSSINVQKSPSRILGADDIVFVATVVGGIAATANLIEYSIKVAKAINNWRRKLREKGIEPKGTLEHPVRPSLDLSTATDEEIEEWLSRK